MRAPKQYQCREQYMQHSGIAWRVTVLAVINPEYDWAAYISASMEAHMNCPGGMTSEEAQICCQQNGNKLLEEVARAYFPSIKEPYRD